VQPVEQLVLIGRELAEFGLRAYRADSVSIDLECAGLDGALDFLFRRKSVADEAYKIQPSVSRTRDFHFLGLRRE
jgi:hypothetical protein